MGAVLIRGVLSIPRTATACGVKSLVTTLGQGTTETVFKAFIALQT